MANNVGAIDRIARLLVASGVLYCGLVVYVGTPVGAILTAVAAVLVLTALFGFCGLYSLLGINTRSARSE